jgi:hypothetical protein
MKKVLSFLFLIISTFSFSQDTIFNKKLSEVVISTTTKKQSSVSVINSIRNSYVVSDGISIEYIKKTPDRTVGDALKRISGVTIQNDKFVLVRGLSDRYNSAILNKTQLPSTEPDRKTFSFDIIPVNLIDNVIIAKSHSANLPGDFAGGLVQITTKDITNNFFTLGLGIGHGTISTLRDFKSIDYLSFPKQFPSTYAYRVASNGDKRAYTKLINSPVYKTFTSQPNLNGSFSFGVKKSKWNFLASAVARNSYSINYTDRKDYQSSTELAYLYKDTSFTKVFSANGLMNIVYIGKNRYSLKTIANHQIENLYLTRSGENYDNVQNVMSNSSNTIVKTIVNSQLDAKINSWDLNLGYNLMLRDQPDYRVNPITKSLNVNEPYAIAWRDTYRFWSVMDENSFNANFNRKLDNIKIGGGYLKKLRNFQARIFRYETTDMLNEITNNTDKYKADFDLANAYTMYDGEYKKWKINSGLRMEYNLFNVSTADFSGQKVNVNRNYLDLLPSINVSYNVEKSKYRLSASKTLSRPEFREVSNFAYYDFVRNAQLLGNPKLEKSDIYNLDLKYEFYPKSSENISVSLFGKNFIKPIEQIVADGSVPSNLLLSFTNPKSANVYGIEFEIRKKINNWIDVYTNTALINSEVKINGVKRQLQGQSKYLINSGLNLHKDNNTVNVTYNRVGDRISAVGFQGYPDIFENSRNVIDFVYLRKINKGEIKIAISDILAQPSIYYQKTKGELIKTNNEQTISLTLNFNL